MNSAKFARNLKVLQQATLEELEIKGQNLQMALQRILESS
jgi:hypothetical protein